MKLQTILAVSTGVCIATLSHIEPRQAVGQAITRPRRNPINHALPWTSNSRIATFSKTLR